MSGVYEVDVEKSFILGVDFDFQIWYNIKSRERREGKRMRQRTDVDPCLSLNLH